MMDRPVFSITMASRRNYNYRWFYDTLVNNDTPFEIVFVGPNPPLELMPDNFKHIYSTATPCQCTEIAVRNAVGEYVLLISDDCQLSDKCLDRLYAHTQNFDMDKFLIVFHWVWDCPTTEIPFTLFTPSVSVFRKDIWIELGGLDRRFHSTLSDWDMQHRFFEYGMSHVYASDCYMHEDRRRLPPGQDKPGHPEANLCTVQFEPANKLFRSFWIIGIICSLFRIGLRATKHCLLMNGTGPV